VAKHISCCGFDCSKCKLYVPKEQLASIVPGDKAAAGITGEWENRYCGGCRSEVMKFHYCEACEIRKCVLARGIVSCFECSELNVCPKAAAIRKR